MGKGIKKVKKELEAFTDKIIDTYGVFCEAINLYLENGLVEETEEKIIKVRSLEAEADLIRRGILRLILEGDLLSSTREEFLSLVEKIDKIADAAEKISVGILLESVDKNILDVNIVQSILSITGTQVEKLKKAVLYVFKDFDKAFDMAHSMEIEEKEVDTLESVYVNELVKKDIPLYEKMYYKGFITQLAKISDLIEDIGDDIEKISIIRKV